MNAKSTITLNTGNRMPIIGLGTWRLTGSDALGSIKKALQLGYRMIDTSGDYHNHRQVGDAIRDSHLDREQIFLVTKVEEDEESYAASQTKLEELGMDYADLMLIHRPPQRGAGEQLWEGLIRARDDGLARDIGVSNYSIDEIEQIVASSDEIPAVNQIEWSPFGYGQAMLDYCRRNGIIIQAYSPLTRQTRLDETKLQNLAEGYHKTPAQIMVRWNIQNGVVPIPKATSQAHLQQNLAVFDFEISAADMEKLDNFNEQYSALADKPLYVSSS